MKEAGKYAMEGFHNASTLKDMILCTHFRIASCVLELSYEDGRWVML